MRSWLTYIFLSMVACATVLTSCNNVLDEEGIAECDDRTTVRLTISFGGDGGPMSRDVTPPTENDDLDYSTEPQAEIVAEDIYALVVDAFSGKFLYRIKDLDITEEPAENDNYYTRTLEGTMIQTTQPVKIVLLANLVQNNITVNDIQLSSKDAVVAFIDGYEGKNEDVKTIYNQLIYNYNGTPTPWTLTGDNARRIPMWGESQSTTVPPAQDVTLTCYLYRALAKVQIWVNMKKGIEDFVINKIKVNNIHTKGYCKSSANYLTTGPNYKEGGNYVAYPYATPSVPTDAGFQTVTYGAETSLNVKTNYSDMIYLPEQFNFDADGKELSNAVIIEVTYNYNGDEDKIGTIHFTEDIIRNHSYIFNINVSNDAEPAMYYEVINWTSVNNGTLNFGNGNGDVTNPNGNTTIE